MPSPIGFPLSDIHPECFHSAKLAAWLGEREQRRVTLGSLDTACFVLAPAGQVGGGLGPLLMDPDA
ncbi:MAG: hypothetical protein JSW68_14780 [Burkholderiales bacterium]|nr:MAG: hypothetical protein JSW68_14780 [Burkholderiales bacterium]